MNLACYLNTDFYYLLANPGAVNTSSVFLSLQHCRDLTEPLRQQSYFRVSLWSVGKNVPLAEENCFSSA